MEAGTTLLVTPDRANQSFLATALEANGVEVMRAERYEQALEMFLLYRPRGVIIEYPVHVDGGLDLVRELQPFRPDVTKVIAIVAHVAPDGPAVVREDVDLLLRMPISAAEIASRTAALLLPAVSAIADAPRESAPTGPQ